DTRDSRLRLTEETVADPNNGVRIHQRKTTVNLNHVRWPPAGADFLKLQLRVNYPPWWKVRKPSRLNLQISFADGKEKSVGFVIEPEHSGEIWVYPWDEKEMGRYFSPDESQWR